MQRSRLSSAAAALLAVVVAGGILVDLEALAAAMACCAASDYECATLGAPDDCCQSMGHVAGSLVAAPPSKSIAGPAFVAVVVSTLAASSVDSFVRGCAPVAFKPPHSPPPLNSAPLRI
jgi:hypothetical protein